MAKEDKSLKYARLKFFVLIGLFILAIAFSLYLHGSFEIKELFEKIKDSPFWFIILYVGISFIPLPFVPLSFIGGFFFTWHYAFLYTFIASTLFACIMFWVARFLGRDFVHHWIVKNEKGKKLNENVKKHSLLDVIMLRFFFIIPSEFVNVIAGLSDIRFDKYFLGTLIGNAPVLLFSIMVIRGKIKHDNLTLFVGIIGLVILLIIPLIFIGKLSKHARNHIDHIKKKTGLRLFVS